MAQQLKKLSTIYHEASSEKAKKKALRLLLELHGDSPAVMPVVLDAVGDRELFLSNPKVAEAIRHYSDKVRPSDLQFMMRNTWTVSLALDLAEEEAEPTLLDEVARQLRRWDPRTKRKAALLLGRSRRKEALPALKDCLKRESSDSVREAVEQAIELLEKKP